MWVIRHDPSNAVISSHKTKKEAVAVAEEMTQAHRQIDARHEGQAVTFSVEKAAEEPAPFITEGD